MGKNKDKKSDAETSNPIHDADKEILNPSMIYDYTFCLIYEANEKTGEPVHPKRFAALKKLTKKGLILYAYRSFCKKKIIVLIKMPEDKMKKYAEEIGAKVELDKAKLKELAEMGDPEANVAPLAIEKGEKHFYDPYRFIFAPYRDELEHLYKHTERRGAMSPFSELFEMQITKRLIEERPEDGTEAFKIRRFLKSKQILAFFPIHAIQAKLGTMENVMVPAMSFNPMIWARFFQAPPFHMIRNYFGEKISFFFLFEHHYGLWLLIPAFFGLPMQIAVLSSGNFSMPALPAMAFITAIWAIFMMEFWKRKEKTYAMEWGVTDAEEDEPDRPDFPGPHGKKGKSPVTGRQQMTYPRAKQYAAMGVSMVTVATLAACAVGIVIGIYIMKSALRHDVPQIQTIASVINSLQITFFDILFNGWLAFVLTDAENHRTDTQYQDSILVKLFGFQFVNAYSSFFYVAFAAQFQPVPDGIKDKDKDDFTGECLGDSCMPALATNLAILFTSRLATGAITKMLLPSLMKWYNDNNPVQDDPESAADEALIEKKKTIPEKQMELAPYDSITLNIQSYMELAIQFGYVALFVTALPAAPFIAHLSVFFDLRANAFQLLHQYQRPEPSTAEDIGAWQTVFELLAMAAVVTNAGIMSITMTTLWPENYAFERTVLFVVFQWGCIILQFVVAAIIPDVPTEVNVQLERQKFLVAKCINKDPDADQLTDEVAQVPTIVDYPF